MTFEPYMNASTITQVHVFFAASALFIGPLVLWRKRRDRAHKIMGYYWVVAMAVTAVSALFIRTHIWNFWFGPIHLFSVFTLWGIFEGMSAIFRKDIVRHQATMQNLYVRGLALAGAFNFLPGRTTQRALIPDQEWLGYAVIAVVLIWAFVPLFKQRLETRKTASKNALAVQPEAS